MYDFTTGEETVLDESGANNTMPDIGGSRVVWQTFDDEGHAAIRLHDLKTGESRTLASPSLSGVDRPLLSGDYVVWTVGRACDVVNIPPSDVPTGVFAYDLRTDEGCGSFPTTSSRPSRSMGPWWSYTKAARWPEGHTPSSSTDPLVRRHFRPGGRLHSVRPGAFGGLSGNGSSRPFFLKWERRAVRLATMDARLMPYLSYYSSGAAHRRSRRTSVGPGGLRRACGGLIPARGTGGDAQVWGGGSPVGLAREGTGEDWSAWHMPGRALSSPNPYASFG